MANDELEPRVAPVIPIADRLDIISRREIVSALEQLNSDELAVAHGVVTKMVDGIQKHGRLVLSTDDRSFLWEAISELEDQINYANKSIIRLKQIISRLDAMGEKV